MVEDSRVPTGGEPEQDHGAGLIHQIASPLAETEPRPNCGHPDSVTGACVKCGHDRTVCADCGIDVAASGVGGGSWAPFGHQCKPVVCGEMSGFGDREWYACRRQKGHTDAHRNKSGFAWISASNKIGSGNQPLSETSTGYAAGAQRDNQKPLVVPSLPSADGSIAQALQRLERMRQEALANVGHRHYAPGIVEEFQKDADALKLILLCQSEAQQEIARLRAEIREQQIERGELGQRHQRILERAEAAESSLALLQEQRKNQVQEKKEDLGALCATEGDAHPRSVHADSASHAGSGGWLPIESAPTNQRVLTLNAYGDIYASSQPSPAGVMFINDHVGKPTHWMPLPPAPETP